MWQETPRSNSEVDIFRGMGLQTGMRAQRRGLEGRTSPAVPGLTWSGPTSCSGACSQTYRAEVLPASPTMTRTVDTAIQAPASHTHSPNHNHPHSSGPPPNHPSVPSCSRPQSFLYCTLEFLLSFNSVWGHLSGISRMLPGS